MLIQFTVGNFRSFKEAVTLSMLATKLRSLDRQIDQNNSFIINDKLTLVKTAAIYGANASGKSNLVKALGFMRWFVLNSSKESQASEPIKVDPFRLDYEFAIRPSLFEVVFIQKDILYRYGFEVTKEKVEREWLFYSPHGKEAKLFIREGDEIQPSRKFKGGQISKGFTRPNALFLSLAAQFNNEIATIILRWFKALGIVSGLADQAYFAFTINKYQKDPKFRDKILELINDSDVGITSIDTEIHNIQDPAVFPEDMPLELKKFIIEHSAEGGGIYEVKTIHDIFQRDGIIERVEFDINDESEGTQKLFYLSGPIIDTLQKGRVLVIDEIEAQMHTLLTRKIVSLFNSPVTNPLHAQLIFATHDTNLLSNKLFRRDQIWFVEKDEGGSSHLYSLVELKLRSDRSFENDYLAGRYGGIPILGEVRELVSDLSMEGDHEGE